MKQLDGFAGCKWDVKMMKETIRYYYVSNLIIKFQPFKPFGKEITVKFYYNFTHADFPNPYRKEITN